MTDTPSTVEPGDHLPAGTLVGDRYEIEAFIGEGGFAQVYRARHRMMNHDVAVKVLNVDANPRRARAFEERFLQEARIAASLRHPNVVTIHDFGFTGAQRQLYMAMEYLSGHDLQRELNQRGPMAPTRALPLLCDALDALGLGHKQGIVHKDLKPANLFLVHLDTPREALVVLDFGVARLSQVPGARLTETGTFNGTPQYLPPEYIEHQIVSPALDVYQMGLILVETLTGRPVVNEDNPYRCIVAHCSGDLDVPEQLRQSPLGPVIAAATALSPDDRYPDASAFRVALAAVDPSSVSAGGAPFVSSIRISSLLTRQEAEAAPAAVVSAAPLSVEEDEDVITSASVGVVPVDSSFIFGVASSPSLDPLPFPAPAPALDVEQARAEDEQARAEAEQARAEAEQAAEVPLHFAPRPESGEVAPRVEPSTPEVARPAPGVAADTPSRGKLFILGGVALFAVFLMIVVLSIASAGGDEPAPDVLSMEPTSAEPDRALPASVERWDEAIDALEAQLDQTPDDPALTERLETARTMRAAHQHLDDARAAMKAERHEDAWTHLEAVPADLPSYGAQADALRPTVRQELIDHRMKMAQVAMVSSDWKRAETNVRGVLELDPEHANARQLLKEIESSKPKNTGGGRWPW